MNFVPAGVRHRWTTLQQRSGWRLDIKGFAPRARAIFHLCGEESMPTRIKRSVEIEAFGPSLICTRCGSYLRGQREEHERVAAGA
jgi:hypothetical protein